MRFLLLGLLLAAPALAGAEGSCRTTHDSTDDDDEADPSNPANPFLDAFSSGLTFWRLTVPIPNHQVGSGNPLPSMEVGSVSTLATGGVTLRKFDITNGLRIEADVFWQAPTANTTAEPQVWIGLADEDDPTGTPTLAAGMRVDDSNVLHFMVNGADIGTGSAPTPGSWRRFSTTIRPDRVVEFRVDGQLLLTGGSVDSWYLVKPLEAGGIGFPERPRIDNVSAQLP